MPRRTVPKYSLHKATGQARVRINGQDVYLGVFGSKESHERYAEEISKWHRAIGEEVYNVSVASLTKLYLEHCKTYYRKNGKVTGEVNCIRIILRHLNRKYRNLPAQKFDSLKLVAIREVLISDGYVRTSINQHISRLRGMFKWGAKQKLVDKSVWLDLTTVEGLKEGRTRAVEAEPVGTVPDAFVDAIQTHVTAPVWAMIQLQRYSGMRPGEVIKLRTADLTMSGEIWEYHVPDHKTRHHGKQRVVMLGKQAQEILRPFLTTDLEAYLFNPQQGRQEFTKRNYRSGAKPSVRNGRTSYSLEGYSCAIKRACDAAAVPRWTPNQLRHNFATLARREAGIEASRVLLGHSSAVTTEIYAERDLDAARAVAAKIG